MNDIFYESREDVLKFTLTKFGHEIRIPAMQTGLLKNQLSFRDIFMDLKIIFLSFIQWLKFRYQHMLFYLKFRLQQHFPQEAPKFCLKNMQQTYSCFKLLIGLAIAALMTEYAIVTKLIVITNRAEIINGCGLISAL